MYIYIYIYIYISLYTYFQFFLTAFSSIKPDVVQPLFNQNYSDYPIW